MSFSLPRRVLAVTALTVGATLLTGTLAMASPPSWTPQSGDARATAYAGNVTTCAEAGLPGSTVTLPNLEDATGTYVTITGDDIPSGDTITAVVVKGGPGYNVYQASDLGALPWKNLRSPTNVGGQIPQISHWFACVTKSASGSPGASGTPAPSDSTAPTGASSPGTINSTAPGSTSVTATPAAAAVHTTPPNSQNLAYTGFGDAWLLWLAVALLVVGAGAIALPRLLRRRA